MKWLVGFVVVLVLAAAGLAAYEFVAVKRAEAATPAILARARAEAGPPLLGQLPPDWIASLIAVEDPNFYHHDGVDDGTPGARQTTITQGLVKRLYFRHFRAGFAKIEQSLIARYVLDRAASKTDQLNLMLGLSYFGTIDGREIIGFPNAAAFYFHKPLTALSKHEFLELVAMLMAPNALDPQRHAAANAERVARIERLLAHQCAPRNHADVELHGCTGRGAA